MSNKNIKLKTKGGDVLLPVTLAANVSYGAIDSGVSVADKIANAWNKDNLKGGTNITIDKHINPNVITDDTYALFHLDESLSNEISGSSAALSPRNGNTTNWEYADSATGFGKGVWATSSAQSFDFLLTAPESVYKNAWTLDFRIYNKYSSFSSTYEYLGRLFGAVPSYVLRGTIDYSTTTYGLQFLNTFYVPIYNYNTNQYVYKTGANKLEGHVAFTYDPETYYVTAFFNGVKVGTVTGNAPASLSDTTFFYTRNYSSASMLFDEIRLSKGILYTGDTYEVPTEPYEEESGDPYYEINASNVATVSQVAAKQDTLVSGTNIKTINNTSILGSGNIDISGGDSLPDQTDHAGQFLTTDGADASWTPLDTLPVKLTDNEYTMVEFDGGMLPVPVCVDTLAVDPNTEYIVLLSLDDIAPGTVVRYDVSVAGGQGQLIQTLRIPSILPNGVATRESDTSTGLWSDWNVTQMVVTSQLESNIVQNSTNPVQSQALYTAFAGKQATLVSGTNIKTVNGTSLLGSGDLAIGTDSLPDQTGQSGKFLTTDGTALSWGSAIQATEKGAASGVAPLDANSKVAETYLPSTTLKNTATVTWALTIDGAANTTHGESVNIGHRSNIQGDCSVAIGEDSTTGTYGTALGAFAYGSGQGSIAIGSGAPTQGAEATATGSIAIGTNAKATAADAIQLGTGSNATAGTFNVALGTDKNYQLLTNDGKVPNDRLNVMTGTDGTTAGTAGLVPAPAATDTGKFLKADGTWAEVQGGGVSVPTLTWYTSADWTLSQDGLTLTIADTSSANLVKVYRNGVLLQPTVDYTISGTSLVVPTALTATEKITLEVY